VFTLADELTADQLGWYEAYHDLEPFTFVADDVRSAIIAHTMAATQCKNPPSIAKFVPRWETPERLDAKQSNQALRDWAKAVNNNAT
jgi:hypothetical protein